MGEKETKIVKLSMPLLLPTLREYIIKMGHKHERSIDRVVKIIADFDASAADEMVIQCFPRNLRSIMSDACVRMNYEYYENYDDMAAEVRLIKKS